MGLEPTSRLITDTAVFKTAAFPLGYRSTLNRFYENRTHADSFGDYHATTTPKTYIGDTRWQNRTADFTL